MNRKINNAIAIIIVMLVTFTIASAVEDMPLTAVIDSVSTSHDRNGAEYTRIIIQEKRTLNGTKYTVGVAVMAFGAVNEKAKTLKEGQTLKAIVSPQEYNGRLSYTLQALLM